MTNEKRVAADVNAEEIEKLYARLKADAEKSGYRLNPDGEFTKDLVRSLIVNEKRYGYMACPCRLAAGVKEDDIDIICPCDYRDADVEEFGACFCALYVSEIVYKGDKPVEPVIERRPPGGPKKQKAVEESAGRPAGKLTLPVWRCKVCGYLCAREQPPGLCPICKVDKERFERFM